ncbi:hypothetical protein J6590_031473 [Homalodisca vitripennis]|nr:hypothetical protein J6590_031473 [Homalodisca vitripennis]
MSQNDTHAIGTALKTRFDIPRDFKEANLDMLILAVMWKDNKDVIVLSTLHSDLKFEETKKRKIKRGVEEEVKNP